MRLLILDFTCPTPYDPETLRSKALGGTEATVVRVAEGLSEFVEVVVAQHCRFTDIKYGARYVGLNSAWDSEFTHVLVLRNSSVCQLVAGQWPRAKVYLWCHDIANHKLGMDLPTLCEQGVTALAVSNWHRTNIVNTCKQLNPDLNTKLNVVVSYNPIDDDLKESEGQYVSKNKLVFFSSPHKGLEQTLKLFSALHYRNPKLELYVANPGYLADSELTNTGVIKVGAVSHDRALEHVRSALCVFYPNYVFPETFGLVFAEANAVGTPVLTHDVGAAAEILDKPQEQLVDCREVKEVVNLVESWYSKERPRVTARPEFRLKEVLCNLMEILKKGC